MVDLLRDQIDLTAQQLMLTLYRHNLGCNRKWATQLDGNLDSIKYSSKTKALILTIQRSVQMQLPSSPSGSRSTTSFSSESPTSPPHNQLLSINRGPDSLLPANDNHWSGTNTMLSYVPETELAFIPLETFADQASPASDPFGFTPGNHWPEHCDTWRQS
jgi:hypothetical protein